MSEQNPPKSKIGEEYKIESTYVDNASKIIGKISDIPKVVVDIGGGAAKGFPSQLLEKVGCDVVTINSELEKSSRGPDPTVDILEELVTNTKNRDIGFAFDMDGDRLVIVINGEKRTLMLR
uniref:Phosphoglucomutase/phosphomannomutase (Pmm-pgm) n=1 Tax=uncultured marine thaumarchaeote SAT1000_12_G12 TaxID=1456380 RepID=A0A075I5J3_9ARCH|nr:phosphoglucomutase/phosphomannomutase (pmm-pgm) [uncultured marine thaumarchaeote SAT1000_12_G12]